MYNKILYKITIFSFTILLLAGCSYSNIRYNEISSLRVDDKRSDLQGKELTGFIRPAETKRLVAELIQDKECNDAKVELLFAYVKNLEDKKEVTDYWQFPEETINEGGGDCEDKVFLLVSAMIAAGMPDVYAVKGRYLGGGHFWVEYKEYIIDPSQNKIKWIRKKKALGYTPFFKFNEKVVYVNEKIATEAE